MLELIAELTTASNLVEVALSRYLNACEAIQVYYSQCCALSGVPDMLSNCVAREMATTSSYESRIKQARSIIGQARNCTTTLTPIHLLPSEVLIRIFQFTASASCGTDANQDKLKARPGSPEVLSHVCSRWRRIALDLPNLWTHIDLVYHHSATQEFVDRATVFVSRARDLPLDVHIQVPFSLSRGNDIIAVYEFLAYMGKRITSVDLAFPGTMGNFQNAFYDFLIHMLEPEILQRLSIVDHGFYAPQFIRGSDDFNGWDEDENMEDRDAPEGHCLGTTHGHFESFLLRIPNLHLNGIYPRWKSQAYHGLVELRLDQPPKRPWSITASRLRNIFIASPNLVVLHFGLWITNDLAKRPDVLPVPVSDLAVLSFEPHFGQPQLELFFSLIVPGPKPLQLSLPLGNMEILSNHGAPIATFLKHSKITRLCIRGDGCAFAAEKLLVLLPHLRILALQGYRDSKEIHPFQPRSGNTCPPPSLQLDTIYLQEGSYDLEYLGQLIKNYAIQFMVVWRIRVYRADTYTEMREEELKAELLALCPGFRNVDYGAVRPIEWGF